jgi:hypothetical protein
MNSASSAVSGGLTKIGGMLKSFAGPVVAAVGVGKLMSSYLTQADALGKFSRVIGESVTKIDAWSQATKMSGGSAESFKNSLSALTKSITEVAVLGSGRAKVAFEALGISAKDSSGNVKKGTDVLLELAEISETMDKSEFMGFAKRLGLDQGTIHLLQTGKKAVEDVVKAKEGLSFNDEDVKTAEEFNDSWYTLNKSFLKFASVIFTSVLPAITWLMDSLSKLVQYLSKHEYFIKSLAAGLGVLALVIYRQVIPAFLKMAASLLANPLTWIVAGIIAISLAIEDLLVWLDGGESAFGEFWESILGDPAAAKAALEQWKADIVEGLGIIKNDAIAFKDAVVNLFNYIVNKIVGVANGIVNFSMFLKQKFFEACTYIQGLIDKFIIAPIEKMFDLVNSAKDIITGGKTSLEAQERKHEEAAARAQARKDMEAGQKTALEELNLTGIEGLYSPGGDTTITTDNNVSVNIGNITIETNATDAEGIAKDFSENTLKDLVSGYNRPVK